MNSLMALRLLRRMVNEKESSMPVILLSLLLAAEPTPSQTIDAQVAQLYEMHGLDQIINDELDQGRDTVRRMWGAGPHAGMGMHLNEYGQFDTSVNMGLGLSFLVDSDDFALSPALNERVSKQVKARMAEALAQGRVPTRNETREWAQEKALKAKVRYLSRARESLTLAGKSGQLSMQSEFSYLVRRQAGQFRLVGTWGLFGINVGAVTGVHIEPNEGAALILGGQISTMFHLSELDSSNLLEPYLSFEQWVNVTVVNELRGGVRYTFDLI